MFYQLKETISLIFIIKYQKKMKIIDPKKYNLSSRVILKESSNGQIFLIINRKSRIIMKDGNRILDIIQKIKALCLMLVFLKFQIQIPA